MQELVEEKKKKLVLTCDCVWSWVSWKVDRNSSRGFLRLCGILKHSGALPGTLGMSLTSATVVQGSPYAPTPPPPWGRTPIGFGPCVLDCLCAPSLNFISSLSPFNSHHPPISVPKTPSSSRPILHPSQDPISYLLPYFPKVSSSHLVLY